MIIKPKPIFLLISGKKGHGKNFFAQHLQTYIEKYFGNKITVEQTSFAKPIKEFCHNVFGFSFQDMETEDGKEKLSHIKWSDINKDICLENNKSTMRLIGQCTENGEECSTGCKKGLYDYFPSDKYMTIREILQIVGTDVWRKRFYEPIWCQAAFLRRYQSDIVIITDCRFKGELLEGLKHKSINIRVHRPKAKQNLDQHQSEIDLDEFPWKEDELFLNEENNIDNIYMFIYKYILPKLNERI